MKPIVKSIIPFDANYDYNVTFSWSGSRAYGNRIVITNAETLSTVMDETITTYSLSHTIPAGTLTNGNKYLVQIAVYDYQNTSSELSNKYAFYVFTTPTFEFVNIKDNAKFENASVQAIVNYSQLEFEDIDSYQFYLYDKNYNILQITEQMYGRSSIVYTYKGLENDTYYYIQCVGVTVNGMPIETDKIKINIKYENNSAYARFFAEPDPKHGGNKWSTNMTLIESTSEEEYKYIDGTHIDLRENKIFYDNGFILENDGCFVIKGKHLFKTNHIFSVYNQELPIYQMNIYSYLYDDTTLRFKVVANNSIDKYIIYSLPMTFTDEDEIEIRVHKKNNIYSIETYIEGVKVE